MRIFIFGPCHYLYLKSCGLPSLKQYKTPLGNIDIDIESFYLLNINELKKNSNKKFTF